MSDSNLQDVVKQRYGQAAEAVRSGAKSSCCSCSCDTDAPGAVDPITKDLYRPEDLKDLPEEAFLASLGCGNPTALAELHAGDVVLDLGSGGGIDVLLSARRVEPEGKAFGLDMTDEMLALARDNQAKAGATNVEFLRGTIEDIPLPDASVDVIISNCVINLSGDKDKVLREAHRVLKPGGRFAVSDIVLERELPIAVQKSVALWTGCVAGALVKDDYRDRLERAGFDDVSFEVTRTFDRQDAADMASSVPESEGGPDAVLGHLDELDGAVASSFIRARKPSA